MVLKTNVKHPMRKMLVLLLNLTPCNSNQSNIKLTPLQNYLPRSGFVKCQRM